MLKEQLKQELNSRGWKEDRYGHHQRTLKVTNRETGEVTDRKYRVKIQATSVRVEVKPDDFNQWIKVDGAYFKDIKITENGSIQIGRKQLK